MRDENGQTISPKKMKYGGREDTSKKFGLFGPTEECIDCGAFNYISSKKCRKCGTVNLDYFTLKERQKHDFTIHNPLGNPLGQKKTTD